MLEETFGAVTAEANHRSRIIILSYRASRPVTSAERSNLKHVCYTLLKPPCHVFYTEERLDVVKLCMCGDK